MVPKPRGPSFRNGEFGPLIYFWVGFLTLLLLIAANATLKPNPLIFFCHKPNPYSL